MKDDEEKGHSTKIVTSSRDRSMNDPNRGVEMGAGRRQGRGCVAKVTGGHGCGLQCRRGSDEVEDVGRK